METFVHNQDEFSVVGIGFLVVVATAEVPWLLYCFGGGDFVGFKI